MDVIDRPVGVEMSAPMQCTAMMQKGGLIGRAYHELPPDGRRLSRTQGRKRIT